MSTIVYQVVNGRKYAYESTSYWDTKKQAPRSKRKYLGRVDPDTGEIITKKSHVKTAKKDESQTVSMLRRTIADKDAQIAKLQDDLNGLRQRNKQLEDFVHRFKTMADQL